MTAAIQKFAEFASIEYKKIEEIFLVLLEGNQDEFSFEKPTTIDVESLETVIDMFYEDYLSKNPQPVPPVPKIPINPGVPSVQRAKVYPNSEILRILQRVLETAFKGGQTYEITANALEQSNCCGFTQLPRDYTPTIRKEYSDYSLI